ncbi:NUDIX hydrolase [Herbiconiux solani]|uniref:NUDIX hydrolase n=1 Tax=Herbiconiux solani TaxID=661329 RepID=UPI000824C137|nr:NUDIX domain-containing protein [Herbiconiux solani]
MGGEADAATPAGSLILKSRVLLLDQAGHALLFYTRADVVSNPTRWLTPGGHLEPGETHREAAVRELFEETGLVVTEDALGEPFYSRDFEASPAVGVQRAYHEEWYLHRVPRFAPVDTNWTDDERVDVEAWRWWSLEEVRASDEVFEPGEFGEVLGGVVG